MSPTVDAVPAATPVTVRPLFPGDTGILGRDTRIAIVRLVRGPYLDGRSDPQAWAAMRRDDAVVRRYLSELFLTLVVDDTDKVAFTRQAEEDDSAFPKVLRRWPLTLIDSALLLFLRQELSSVSGSGQRVVVGLDEIIDHLRPYRDDSATDHALQLRRIHASVAKMRDNGVLRPTATDDRYEIAPVLRLLLPPEQIAALVRAYDRLAGWLWPLYSAITASRTAVTIRADGTCCCSASQAGLGLAR